MFAASWSVLLERLDEAVLVLDSERQIRYVSPAARRLLRFADDEPLGGRCRLTTDGRDCADACPLTCALEGAEDEVADFAAVYRSTSGRPVPVNVTVVVLRDEEGSVVGAMEILRPREPELGFYLRGTSAVAEELRHRVRELAASNAPVVIVGEGPANDDVARAIHRAGGLSDDLFQRWPSRNGAGLSWPPGTLYVGGEGGLASPLPSQANGWRLLVGTGRREEGVAFLGDGTEVLELPTVKERAEDLPAMLGAWIGELGNGTRVASGALDRLTRLTKDIGLTAVREILVNAVTAADGELREEHIPVNGYGNHLIEEMLGSDNPLAAVERCVLRELLCRCEWRMQEAADRLGVSRVTLWRKLRDHGIEKQANE